MSWLRRISEWWRGPSEPPSLSAPHRALLEAHAPFAARLDADERARLDALVARFLAEKTFIGVDGLEVTDQMRVVVAAYACLLMVGRPDMRLYPTTREVILHAGIFGQASTSIGPDGRHYEARETLAGRADYRGPVLLAWESVIWRLRAVSARRNVVIHEFAHKLDFLDGLADGTPPLESRREVKEWVAVFSKEFERLRAEMAQGHATLLDPYGATNPAEFFAVASELFFEQPAELAARHAALFAQLQGFYRQDPRRLFI